MSTRVNMGTKMADSLIYEFNRRHFKGETLYEVYKSPSSAKIRSWENIKHTCEGLNGWNLHIVGASCHTYSCIYAFKYTDTLTGEVFVVIRKETNANTYDLYMTVEEYEANVFDVVA